MVTKTEQKPTLLKQVLINLALGRYDILAHKHKFTRHFFKRVFKYLYAFKWINQDLYKLFPNWWHLGDYWYIFYDAHFHHSGEILVAVISLRKEASGSHLGFVVFLKHKTYFIKQAKMAQLFACFCSAALHRNLSKQLTATRNGKKLAHIQDHTVFKDAEN